MTELRKFHRAPSSQRIEMVHKGCRHPGCLDNISLSGALVHLDYDLDINIGELCLLRIHPEGADPLPPLEIWAEAVHGNSHLIGMKFLGCDDDTSRHLALLRERRGSEPDRLKDDLERIRVYLAGYHGTPKGP